MKKKIYFIHVIACIVMISAGQLSYGQTWFTTGNVGLAPTDYFGTGAGELNPLVIKTNGVERLRIGSGGFIGINTALPFFPIDMTNTNYLRSFNLTHALNTASANSGFYCIATNAGTGSTYGYYSDVPSTSDGSGTQGGFFAGVAASGAGSHYGLNVSLSGSGTGAQYGSYASVTTTGNGTKYGSYTTLSGTGGGTKYGFYNSISSNAGTQYGFYTTISGTGISPRYGSYQTISGTGTGPQYGSYSTISNTGTGNHYGVYSVLSGTGNGTQYGLYSNITNTGSGIKYGVYSDATGSSNYAFYGLGRGYFSGNVGIDVVDPTGKLNIANNEVDITSGGSLILGTTDSYNLAFDANEIHARNNSNPSPLYVNGFGEAVIINNQGDVNEASLSSDGALRLGSDEGRNLSFDDDEIQSRNNGDPETLFLNPAGGHVAIGYEYIGGCAGDCPELSVCGEIRCTEVTVESGWCDYVFGEDYNLMPLETVADSIQALNHLPGVPSANEISSNGLNLAETSEIMMQKIEELTLYLIQQNEQLKKLQEENAKLSETIAGLKN